MPMPPTLPALDWRAIHTSGVDWKAWLAKAEKPPHAEAMKATAESLALPAAIAGALGALPRAVNVVAIAEDWCGDVVRHAPVLQRMAQAAPRLSLRFITRMQYPDAFARFLTNGGEAIPKFIFLSADFVECGNWGPMPEACRKLIARGKACGNVAAARQKVSAIYAAELDRAMAVNELLELAVTASAETP